MKHINKAAVAGALMAVIGVICLMAKAFIIASASAILLPVGFGLFFVGIFVLAAAFFTWDYQMGHQEARP